MIFKRMRQQLRPWLKQRQLQILWKCFPDRCYIDYGCIKLLFSNDGDSQEFLYHMHARKWYQSELNALAAHVKPGDHVVDVGANMGFISAILSGMVGAQGRVIAFEPNLPTFSKLQRTIELNGLGNVMAHNLGCGAEEGQATLSWLNESSGLCHILDTDLKTNATSGDGGAASLASHIRTETVNIVKLDTFLLEYPHRITFLKIDTEGFESRVLAGAHARIAQDRPVIYIELTDEFKASSEEAFRILTDLHYTLPGLPDPANLRGVVSGTNFMALP